MQQAQYRQRDEPEHHDRPERRRDAGGAGALHREQPDENENRQRHDVMFERRRSELETFDCGQDRNRRRDHGIGDEHRSADHAQRQQWPASAAERALPERHQRQRAALAIVVGAQQQQHIFYGDDDKQRPQDHAENAEHDVARYRTAMRRRVHSLAKRIQRRGADIAEHHADTSQRQGPEAGGRRRRLMGFGCGDAESHDA